MADSADESFEGFDSEDIREAEKRLASKMKEIRSTAERLDQLEQESVDLDVNNNEHEGSSVNDENDFDFFMNDKESVVEQEKEVDNDWDIPEWFSSDKKRKEC
uniref:Uncharacterized protein n=1 Tax=Magallana gigas TaxID=29159 RepID=A0A8W8IBF6_MAGGI